MRPHVPDELLRPADVPTADASWADVVVFGHSYHAYKIAGSVQRVAARTVEVHDTWMADGTLPGALGPLRLALFHTVRALEYTADPDPATVQWARSLVAAIEAILSHDDGRG